MAYKIRKNQPKPKFSEKAEYFLVDLENSTYDNHTIKGWKKAVNLNMLYQMYHENKIYIIPIEKEEVLKHKELKNKNFL
jgi:hypothetical protein